MSQTQGIPNFLAIVGPTASGKSALALALAEKFNGEIVSCDSIQLYKELNIGSAKPNKEEIEKVAHHVIDILNADQTFDAGAYSELALKAIHDIVARGRIPIVVGGTGLYLRALCGAVWDDLPADPNIREKLATRSTIELFEELQSRDRQRALSIHPHDRYRIMRAIEIHAITGKPFAELTAKGSQTNPQHKTVFLNPPMRLLDTKIRWRTKRMLQAGIVDETRCIIERYGLDAAALKAIGYAQICGFFQKEKEMDCLESLINIATHQYAKRQKTWFRKNRSELVVCEDVSIPSITRRILELTKIVIDKL